VRHSLEFGRDRCDGPPLLSVKLGGTYFLVADNRVKAASCGGIEAVVAAMEWHVSSVGVQEQACGALCNLALNGAKHHMYSLFKLH
jgi:hypothetical protein